MQTIMTARQLLSILRLSQALARIRFLEGVTSEEVDEVRGGFTWLDSHAARFLEKHAIIRETVVQPRFYIHERHLLGAVGGPHVRRKLSYSSAENIPENIVKSILSNQRSVCLPFLARGCRLRGPIRRGKFLTHLLRKSLEVDES